MSAFIVSEYVVLKFVCKKKKKKNKWPTGGKGKEEGQKHGGVRLHTAVLWFCEEAGLWPGAAKQLRKAGGCIVGADSGWAPWGTDTLDAGRVEWEPKRRQWAERGERDGRFHKEQGFHRSSSLALLFLFAPDVLTINQEDRGMVWKDKSAQSSPCFKPSVVPLLREQNPYSFIPTANKTPGDLSPPPFSLILYDSLRIPPPLCALGWNHPWHLDVCWKSLLNKEIHP